MKWFLVALVLFACGGGDAQTPAVAPAQAPAELREVVFAQPPSGDEVTSRVATALEGAMIHAGYRMAQSTDAHDFLLRTKITYAREPSVWRTNINGRESFNIRVRVVLSILQKEQMVDQGSTEFVTDNEDPIAESAMAPLVNGIGRSERIRRTAQQTIQARTASPEGGDRDADEKAWIGAKVEGCRQPIRLDACDKVRLYIADHADGGHIEDAKKALEASQPVMEKLQKDENDWQRADTDECKSKRTQSACTGVELYLKFHPGGMHAKEARALQVR
jgi:hypothetical protein